MKARHLLALCSGLLLCLLTTPALAQSSGPGSTQPGRNPAEEQAIYSRLAAINPAAVPLFQKATQALDSGDFTGAKADYQQVLALAPNFPDALRRLSYVLGELKDYDGAV